MVVSFSGYLQGKMTARGTRKPVSTALKLKIATIALLEKPGYHAMTIDDICAESQLAKGTFYLHFESKQAITLAILEEFVELQARLAPAIDEKRHAFENLRAMVTWVSEFFRENMGLQRNLMQLADTIPEVAAIWQQHTRFLASHVRKSVERDLQTSGTGEDLMFLTIYLLGNMLDQLLYAVYAVHRQSHLERVAGSFEHTVEVVSLLWYRALFAENPPAQLLATSTPLLTLARKRRSRA
jgi:AcrR family transcriptional regulator